MVEEVIRGINDAYSASQKALSQYKEKLAKEKILTGNVSSNFHSFNYDLKTQKGFKFCMRFSKSYTDYYIMSNVISRYSTYIFCRSSYIVCGDDFEDLYNKLKEHRQCCLNNVIARIGKLKIGFYKYDSEYFLSGVVDNSIVFLYELKDLLSDNISIYVDENSYINVLLDSYCSFRLDASDYSIEQ